MASRKRAANSDQDDLFNEAVSLLLPPRFAIDSKVLGSSVRQLAVPALREICRLQPFSIRRVNGYEFILSSGETLKIISSRTATQLDADLVLLVPEASEPSKIAATLELGEGRWMNVIPTDIGALDAVARRERLAAVTRLLAGCVSSPREPSCREWSGCAAGATPTPDRRASRRARPCYTVERTRHHRHADRHRKNGDDAGAERPSAV